MSDPQNTDTAAAISELRKRFIPNRVLACRAKPDATGQSPALAALFAGKSAAGPGPTVYICEQFACQAPISGKDGAIAQWDKLAGPENAPN